MIYLFSGLYYILNPFYIILARFYCFYLTFSYLVFVCIGGFSWSWSQSKPVALQKFNSFLLFATPIFADTSVRVLSTAFKPSMPSRGAEIFIYLKQLFSSNFWPKTANFKLRETESLVFAKKYVIYFILWSYFRATNRRVLTRAFLWWCQKIPHTGDTKFLDRCGY